MKLSIIVPVYNVEKYLDRCLESIIKNNVGLFEDKVVELIIVNDGSTDTSGDLVDKWKAKYNFIRSFEKSNGGLSSARNFGLEHAVGTFVWFIDSDDWIDDQGVSIILKEISNHPDLDLLEFDLSYAHEESNADLRITKCDILSNFRYLEGETKEALQANSLFISVCNKIIKRSFFADQDNYFPTNRLSEDHVICVKLFLKLKFYKKLNASLYFYFSRENSITSNKNLSHLERYIKDQIQNMKEVLGLLNEYEVNFKSIVHLNSFITSNMILTLLRNKFSYSFRVETINELTKAGLYPIPPYNYLQNGAKLRNLFRLLTNRRFILKQLFKFL